MDPKLALIAALIVITVFYCYSWWAMAGRKRASRRARHHEPVMPTPLQTAIGFVTNFFDTLGIGSFATTTAMFRSGSSCPTSRFRAR